MSRRRFLGGTVAAGGLVVAFNVPFPQRAVAQGMGGAATPAPATGAAAAALGPSRRDELLGRDPARRDRHHPRRPLRDGPGHADRPGAARRRRARMRLGQGLDRVPDARPEPRPQPDLGQLLDRRQPRRARVARLRAQGRRDRARDAGAGGGRRLEGAGRRMHGREGRDHAQAERPHDDLRQGLRSGGEADAADRRGPEGSEGLEDRRPARRPPRHRGEGRRLAGLRHGPEAARHAERRDQGVPGVRRQGQALRRRRDREPPRCQEGGAGRRLRRRGGRRHLVAREDGARCAADRVGLRPERSGLERDHRGDA